MLLGTYNGSNLLFADSNNFFCIIFCIHQKVFLYRTAELSNTKLHKNMFNLVFNALKTAHYFIGFFLLKNEWSFLIFLFIFSIKSLLTLLKLLFEGFINFDFAFESKFYLWFFKAMSGSNFAKRSTLSVISKISAISLLQSWFC